MCLLGRSRGCTCWRIGCWRIVCWCMVVEFEQVMFDTSLQCQIPARVSPAGRAHRPPIASIETPEQYSTKPPGQVDRMVAPGAPMCTACTPGAGATSACELGPCSPCSHDLGALLPSCIA
jgi:hypothetical protein